MPRACKYPLAEWPAADRAAWEAATSTTVSLLTQGLYARWAPETKRQAYYAYARWLAYLSEHDPQSLHLAPSDRLTPARLEAFIATLRAESTDAESSRRRMATTINHFVNAVHAIARDGNDEWLRERQRRSRDRSSRGINGGGWLHPVDVYALGLDLMDHAIGIDDALEAARTFRDGLIIAILVSSALRRNDLTGLAIDRDLFRVGSSYQIAITARKTSTRLEHPLPSTLTPYLDDYLRDYRPRFPGANRHSGLWPSTKGGLMCREAIWDAVRRRTRDLFGQPINLHLVRDIAATAAPDLGSPMLGHRKATVTDRYYRRGDPIAASRKMGR